MRKFLLVMAVMFPLAAHADSLADMRVSDLTTREGRLAYDKAMQMPCLVTWAYIAGTNDHEMMTGFVSSIYMRWNTVQTRRATDDDFTRIARYCSAQADLTVGEAVTKAATSK